MRDLSKAMSNLEKTREQLQQSPVLSYGDFLQEVIRNPHRMLRNVYQIYLDMIGSFVDEGVDEYGHDPESIGFLKYDCSKLFVDGSDRPFLPIGCLPTV
jgi:hypothetical protein